MSASRIWLVALCTRPSRPASLRIARGCPSPSHLRPRAVRRRSSPPSRSPRAPSPASAAPRRGRAARGSACRSGRRGRGRRGGRGGAGRGGPPRRSGSGRPAPARGTGRRRHAARGCARPVRGAPVRAGAAGAILCVAASPLHLPRWWGSSRRAFALLLVPAGRAHVRVGPQGDEPHYLMVADSLRRDGDVSLERDYAEGRYRGRSTTRPSSRTTACEAVAARSTRSTRSACRFSSCPRVPSAGYSGVIVLHGAPRRAARATRCASAPGPIRTRAARDGGGAACSRSRRRSLHYAGLVFTEVPAALAVAFGLRRARERPLSPGGGARHRAAAARCCRGSTCATRSSPWPWWPTRSRARTRRAASALACRCPLPSRSAVARRAITTRSTASSIRGPSTAGGPRSRSSDCADGPAGPPSRPGVRAARLRAGVRARCARGRRAAGGDRRALATRGRSWWPGAASWPWRAGLAHVARGFNPPAPLPACRSSPCSSSPSRRGVQGAARPPARAARGLGPLDAGIAGAADRGARASRSRRDGASSAHLSGAARVDAAPAGVRARRPRPVAAVAAVWAVAAARARSQAARGGGPTALLLAAMRVASLRRPPTAVASLLRSHRRSRCRAAWSAPGDRRRRAGALDAGGRGDGRRGLGWGPLYEPHRHPDGARSAGASAGRRRPLSGRARCRRPPGGGCPPRLEVSAASQRAAGAAGAPRPTRGPAGRRVEVSRPTGRAPAAAAGGPMLVRRVRLSLQPFRAERLSKGLEEHG